MISTRDLSLLPDIDGLKLVLQSMAMLDAILCPEWEFRYYSFNAEWASGEQMGSMRNGSGDDFLAHFSPAGCWLKGIAHEYPMTSYRESPPRPWPGVLDAVPTEFEGCLSEPAFSIRDVTFCIWRRYADPSWQIGPIKFPDNDPDPDGSGYLMSNLDGRPETYHAWAEEYYGRKVDLAAVEHVYRHLPITHEVLTLLNSEVSLSQLAADINEIGYPT